jgi:hypothetical protein
LKRIVFSDESKAVVQGEGVEPLDALNVIAFEECG